MTTKKGLSFVGVISFVLVFLLFSFSFVSGQPASSAPKTIKIGASISLTGRFAAGGTDVADGYKIAVKHINDDGGLFIKEYNKKIPIELIIYDDESDPSKTVTRLEKLNSVDKVVAYLGEFASDMNIAGLGHSRERIKFHG